MNTLLDVVLRRLRMVFYDQRFYTALLITTVALATMVVISMVWLKLFVAPAPFVAQANQELQQPLVIKFKQFIKTADTESATLTPAVKGSWQKHSGLLYDELTFTPTENFKANTTYTINNMEVSTLAGVGATIDSLHFTTKKAPSIAKKGVAQLKEGAVIAAAYQPAIHLNSPNGGARKIVITGGEGIEWKEVSSSNDQDLSWKPSKMLTGGEEFTLKVYDQKNDEVLVSVPVKVAADPQLTGPVSDHFSDTDTAKLVFDQPIAKGQDDFIAFDIEGAGAWENATTYAFTPKKVEPSKSYTYHIKEGLKTEAGGILRTTIDKSFSTIGEVLVEAATPGGREVSQSSQTVSFSFDQPVDKASAQAKFSITSGKVGAISWQGNKMSVVVTDLGYQNTVTATVAAGVKNAGFGLPSTKSYATTFTTEYRITRLSVPYYKQQHAGTCAIASARMLLAFKGVVTDEMTILNKVGYSPRAADKSTDPPTWDDPQKMYVGDIDGKMSDWTAAGPDAPPVAKAIKSLGVSATDVTGISTGWVASKVHAGSPVIVFGVLGDTGFVTWKTPTGGTARMNASSHARIVTGVKGEPSNPVGFWVSDPYKGQFYWTASQLAHDISLDAYQQAISL